MLTPVKPTWWLERPPPPEGCWHPCNGKRQPLFKPSFSLMKARRREMPPLPLAPSTIVYIVLCTPVWNGPCPLCSQPCSRRWQLYGTGTRCPQSLIELQWMRRSRWGHVHPWNEESIELPYYRLCSSLLFSPSLLPLVLFFSSPFFHHLHRLDGTNLWAAIPLCYAQRSKNMV